MWFFKKIFSKKNNQLLKKVNKVFLHEDLFCQVELLPNENATDIEKENDTIIEFAKKNYDGTGFSDIYQRGEYTVTTIERKIKVAELQSLVIRTGFEQQDAVYTGYGSYEVHCKNTLAFQLDSAILFCDYGANKIVENIWLDGFRFNKDSEDKTKMISVLNQIGRKWNLILNDWDLCQKIDLSIKNEIRRYVESD